MDIQSIITREEYENIKTVNYDQFCNFLIKFIKLSVEESLKTLPYVMSHLSKQVDYLKSLSTKFYLDNKDLASNKPFVAKIIEQVESENPGKTYEEILKISALKARKSLSEADKITAPNNNLVDNIDSKLKDL